MNFDNITIDKTIAIYSKLGYTLLDGTQQLNVFGVRSTNPVVNTFCDAVCLLYKDYGGSWNLAKYTATTDPGIYWLQNPENVRGTSILIPGRYPESHKVGLHKGEYRALVQNSPLKVWRDNAKDGTLVHDPVNIDVGIFGINIHHAGVDSTQVYNWSAGCQVLAKLSEFNDLMGLVDENIKNGHGEVFSYVLLTEDLY